MPTRDLLPGVTADSCPPAVVCNAREAIRKARRRAIAKDVLQFALLIVVDCLFLRWPEAHVPFLGRGESLMVLRGVNAAAIAQLCLARALPKWTAMRIASTWCRSEREKFQKRARAS
jgi:hypothetical protein